MTGSRALLPLRLPELGPSFGKLVTGTGRSPGGLDLSAVRHRLVTRLFEHAGEGRRLAANDERAAAIATLARASWLAAWEEAIATTADLVWTSGLERLAREADTVTMPPHLRERLFPGPVERRALSTRLGSAGASLIRALDDLEQLGEDALHATSLEREQMDAWLNSLRAAARRLEASWIALEDRVENEVRRYDALAERVGTWRKPLWPVWVVGAAGLAAAIWLGLVLGGFVSAPPFLQPLVAAWPQ